MGTSIKPLNAAHAASLWQFPGTTVWKNKEMAEKSFCEASMWIGGWQDKTKWNERK